tara:strand:+ start:3236 stop:5245 length:2010 start_codon:yes stop_codon:yes gene_type:complete
MIPNNLTGLDFVDIKASIVSYLKTRQEFTDYDFEGSSLSYLVDLLAYNTYYTSFNANMAMNEAFLPSATVRDNVVNVAKLLNYIPHSKVAATAVVNVTLQTTLTNGVYPSSLTIKRGPVASGGNYVWNCLQDTTVEVNPTTGLATFENLNLKEGTLVNFSYIVNTFQTQIYQIPSSDADISTLQVTVKPNESSTTSDIYNRVNNITDVTPTSRVYFVNEGEDQRFEVRFGDDSIGRALTDGEVINFSYLVSDANEANAVQTFQWIGQFTDSAAIQYAPALALVSTVTASSGGADAESVESIKYNAPRYYSSQYRAVTAQDYAILTKSVYDNAESVVAYGGDSLNPPVYGKVYIAVKTRTGSLLNDATKKQIATDLRKYAMASIDPVIVDPEQLYIYNKIFVQYDTGCGSDTSTIKTEVQNAVSEWATQTAINNFNSTFRAQAFEKAITLASKCITDVSLQTTILRYIKPQTNQTNSYILTTGAPLYNSAPSVSSNEGAKEPILLSGVFRTADRPGVNQQFEDDGFGNLRMFYDTGTRKVFTNLTAGTVNYDSGTIVFGPVNIIGSGSNIADTGIQLTNSITGTGSVTDPAALPTDLQIPVQFIPANSGSIPSATPGTVLNIISPEVSIQPLGTIPPPSIPLNSLTPKVFDQTPTVIAVASALNTGSLNT